MVSNEELYILYQVLTPLHTHGIKENMGVKNYFLTEEKISLSIATIFGIDSIVTPCFFGGQSLHQMIGIDTTEQYESMLRYKSSAIAWIGLTYQNIKGLTNHLKYYYNKMKK